MTTLPTAADARRGVGRHAATMARRVLDVGRLVLVGAIAGAIWLGLGSRMAMRVVALANGHPTERRWQALASCSSRGPSQVPS